MHIGIDARFLQGPNTGVTNYLNNLLSGISRIDKDNDYTVFLSDRSYAPRVPSSGNFKVRVNTSNSFVWKNIWLPKEVKMLGIDLVHFPAYTGSIACVGNNVVTVHDLIHKVNPGWFSLKERLLINLPVSIAIKKADAIIADSESTKRDIIKYYNLREDKITVTLLAADSTFSPINDINRIDKLKKKYSIDSDFILNVGVLFKRRNIERLIEAFALLRRDKNSSLKLVIAGPGRKYFDLESIIGKNAVRGEVIYLGYVDQDDLPLLYNACTFFVYPSLYEGFGLPVLEAMSCSKPVITSNVSSLPEILGDSGILIDPYDTQSLYRAMHKLANDAKLREELGVRALERSKCFSWDKMAAETIQIYEDILSSRKNR